MNHSNNDSLYGNISEKNDQSGSFILSYETAIMVTLFPFTVILYLTVLTIIIRRPSDFRNSYYTLVLGLGFSDMAMLLYTLYGFVYDALGYAYLGTALDNFLSFVLYWVFGWYSMQTYNIFLAFNRFFAIVFFYIYKQKATVKSSVILIGINIAFSFAIMSSMLVYSVFEYTPRWKVAFFHSFPPEVERFLSFDENFSYIVAAFIMLLYFISVFYSIFKLKSFSTVRSNYIREIKMLFQGLATGLLLCLVNLIHWMSPPPTLNRISTWLICGMNPIIYLALDGKLRRIFLEKFQEIKKLSIVKSSTVTPVHPYS